MPEITANSFFATGNSPERAIKEISERFRVSKHNAGRLVMTESAYFSSAAQKECFNELGVERYEIVGTFDKHMCPICGRFDGKVLDMKEFKEGITAPPFHPNCTCCTAPYFEELEDVGRRFARDVKTGKAYTVPGNTTYEQWKQMQSEKHEKHLAFSKNDGIIKEKSKSPVTKITDDAVKRVPIVKIAGYTEEQCVEIQKQHKELLKYSSNINDNNEVAFVFDNTMKNRKVYIGSDSTLDFGSALYGKDLFVMHNHPRNGSYSTQDISFFGANTSVKTLSIVKNNGDVEILTKQDDFNIATFGIEYRRLYKKIVQSNTDVELNKFVRTLLTKTKAGVIWSGNK